jgi:secondary thiamine-phosphate synthase enzyme
MITQYQLSVTTPGRGFVDITNQVTDFVATAKIDGAGLCNIFIHHTSASLVVCENADPLVQRDLDAFMCRLIPDGDSLCQHIAEGPDDMPSHVRSILTTSFLSVPITEGKLALGRWQGLYLWEHRLRSYERKLTVTILS